MLLLNLIKSNHRSIGRAPLITQTFERMRLCFSMKVRFSESFFCIAYNKSKRKNAKIKYKCRCSWHALKFSPLHLVCQGICSRICRVYPCVKSPVRDIATHLSPKRLRHYLGCTVQRLFCLDQQLEDRDLFLYISLQRKLAVINPMIMISENIWIISNMQSFD